MSVGITPSLGGMMLTSAECRKLAEHYREQASLSKSALRLVNVLLSVSNAYSALASQLDLLESVQRQEDARPASHSDRAE